MKKTKYVGILVLALCLVVVGSTAAQNQSAQWQKSKHANKELPVHEATWEGRQENTAHCARCHSEQGFKAWVPQLLKGDAGFIKKPDGSAADEAYIKFKDKELSKLIDHLNSHFNRLLKKTKITQAVMPNSFRHLIKITRLGDPETSSG